MAGPRSASLTMNPAPSDSFGRMPVKGINQRPSRSLNFSATFSDVSPVQSVLKYSMNDMPVLSARSYFAVIAEGANQLHSMKATFRPLRRRSARANRRAVELLPIPPWELVKTNTSARGPAFAISSPDTDFTRIRPQPSSGCQCVGKVKERLTILLSKRRVNERDPPKVP
ncbi:MAG: hypothetical protein BWY66_01501 [bacterium ADurb.Bin374]|nr:MAG: hypothetical protein BWY66_01501 [bacterium ADurb.Bin374]